MSPRCLVLYTALNQAGNHIPVKSRRPRAMASATSPMRDTRRSMRCRDCRQVRSADRCCDLAVGVGDADYRVCAPARHAAGRRADAHPGNGTIEEDAGNRVSKARATNPPTLLAARVSPRRWRPQDAVPAGVRGTVRPARPVARRSP
jgi:hypothetical protein